MALGRWGLWGLRLTTAPAALWLVLSSCGGSGDDPSNAGIGPDADCRPVGRYQAGKEGSYRPCCAGLTELVTETLGDVNDELSCSQAPHREYACLEGYCGDGICEEAEAPCGCGVDCPDSLWRSHESECSLYGDAEPPTRPASVLLVNTTDQPLFVYPYIPLCVSGISPTLVQYHSIGPGDDWTLLNTFGNECQAVCSDVMANGWPEGAGNERPYGCPEVTCPPAEPVRIEPGASLLDPVPLVYEEQEMPRGCAAGITTPTVYCYSRVQPESPGFYGISARVSATAECHPPDCEPRVVSRPIGNWPDAETRLELAVP